MMDIIRKGGKESQGTMDIIRKGRKRKPGYDGYD